MWFRPTGRSRYIDRDMINTLRRYVVFFVLALGSLTMAAPVAWAATAPEVVDEVVAQPYVEIQPEEPAPDEPQWTYRYLIPAVVLLTVVLIGGTVVMYFVKVVRGRYTVVE